MVVKINFSPITELVVHDIIKTDIDEILRRSMTPNGSMPLFWCDGILLSFTSLPPTKDVIRDYLQGKIHWAEVRFTELRNYQPMVELHEEQYMKARVIDTSDNDVHQSFVKWVKTRK